MVTFRRQLWSLARTSPGYGPVYTDAFGGYDDDGYDDGYEDEGYGGDLVDEGGDGGPGGLAVAHGRRPHADELAHRRSLVPPGSRQRLSPRQPRRAGGSYRRRRHILAALTVLAIGGVAPAVLLGGAWWVGQGVVGGLLVTYLVLLVRRQRRLAERLQKVRYLAPIRAPRPAVVVLGTGTAR